MSTFKMMPPRQKQSNYCAEKYITGNDVILLDMESTYPEDQTIKIFGVRLRSLREDAQMSQTELSQAVWDIVEPGRKGNQPHISNMENSEGDKLPSVPVLRALAVILKTNTDYLLGLTNNYRSFGDIEDEVVVTVEDVNARKTVQEIAESLAAATDDDREYVAGLVRRLLPKKPRIIGDE